MWPFLFDDIPQFFGVVVELIKVDISVCEVTLCFVDGIGEDEVVFRIRVGVLRGGVDEVDVAVLVGCGEAFDGLVFYEGAVIRIEFVEVFAVEEGGRRWGEVVFVEEIVETGDVRRVRTGRRVGFPFFRFGFVFDREAIEGACSVAKVVLVRFLSVVRYAEYGIVGMAFFTQERYEELVGVLRRLYVGEAFDDGIVVGDGVVVASAVDDGRNEDAVVEVVSAVIVAIVRRMVRRSVMRWSHVGAVRRSVVRSHFRSVRWSIIRAHIGTVAAMWRSVFVKAVASMRRSVFVEAVASMRRSVFVEATSIMGRSAVRLHVGSGLRSAFRLELFGVRLRSRLWAYVGLRLRSGLWVYVGFRLRSGLRTYVGSCLRSGLWFYLCGSRSAGRFHLFGHGACFAMLFYLCRFVRRLFVWT